MHTMESTIFILGGPGWGGEGKKKQKGREKGGLSEWLMLREGRKGREEVRVGERGRQTGGGEGEFGECFMLRGGGKGRGGKEKPERRPEQV